MSTRRRLLAAAVAGLSGCVGVPARRETDTPDRPCPDPSPGGGDARVGLVGDLMLGRSVDDHWDDGPPAGVWNGLLDRLQGLDGLLANLECCLSDRGTPRPGRTYHFRAGPDWAVPALESAGTSFVSLANNHVLDFGRRALADTRRHLSDAGIAHAGAGPDLRAAVAHSILDVGGVRVAVLALTDRSPSYGADADAPGTAYAALRRRDPRTRWLVESALGRARRADPDLVVASLHWGPNWEVRPTEGQRTFARWLIDRGVDVVHGHSAHVIQGVETYRGRPILYDCGDFVDDYLFRDDLHNKRSFLFVLRVSGGVPTALELAPTQIDDETVHPAGRREAAWLRDRMRARSEALGSAVERDRRGLVLELPCRL